MTIDKNAEKCGFCRRVECPVHGWPSETVTATDMGNCRDAVLFRAITAETHRDALLKLVRAEVKVAPPSVALAELLALLPEANG